MRDMKTVFISTCQILARCHVPSCADPPQEGMDQPVLDEPLDKRLSRRSLFTIGAAGLVAAACGGGKSSPKASGTSSATPSPTQSATPPPDPASVRANELGLVPVLMHHRVVDKV